ncbi:MULTISPECIES: MerR family transcriptional regulator [unclassified Chelatococcus]|uniref:MerR family transcriptional regulator n=1 Tax=unclassified Chelatococcus TaxID=2638111 RepID=UPI00030EE319|nr:MULTISPECIES: MerR family transcriptional regulator [unclassified Chelatococcus]ALA18746.1 hypothetical protein AL346_16670 [Chelatococcus sp. CO-6]
MDKGPDAFRTISEVAEDLDLPQHVLRFWETRFSQIKPLKRGGGRRYYRPDDVDLLRGIRHLLYGEGYTIKGVQRILKEEGVRYVETIWRQDGTAPAPVPRADADDEDDASEYAAAPEDGPFLFDDGSLAQTQKAPAPAAAMPAARSPAAEPAPAPTPTGTSGLTAAQLRALQAVLAELAECRRLLEAARHGPEGDD